MNWRRRRSAPVQAEPLDETTRAWLSEQVDKLNQFGFSDGATQPRYEMLRCPHCQGVHFRACPKVREIEYHENGNIRRVRFWPQGTYDDSDVIWPEDVFDTQEVETDGSTSQL